MKLVIGLNHTLKKHVNYFYHKVITEEMIVEIAGLGLFANLLDYSMTGIHKFFAVSFEVYRYHYGFNENESNDYIASKNI